MSTERPTLRAAFAGAVLAIVLAAAINALLTLIAGDTLVVPGELGMAQVLTYTLVMIVPAALVLWLLPRWFVVTVIAVAVLTFPYPLQEFGQPIFWWLEAMHMITGVCAALIAPQVAARIDARRTMAGA